MGLGVSKNRLFRTTNTPKPVLSAKNQNLDLVKEMSSTAERKGTQPGFFAGKIKSAERLPRPKNMFIRK